MTNGELEAIVRLQQLEGVIRRGKRVSIAVAEALVEIRANPLYWEPYTTFEEYCQKRLAIRERTGAQPRKLSRPSPSTDAATAYHEAGHVIAAWCLKIKMRRATIVSHGDLGGLVTIERDKPSTLAAIGRGDRWHSSRLRAERLVMCLQAGEVAHLRYDFNSVSHYHYLLDLENCLQLLTKYAIHNVKPDARPHYDLLYKWTESLIEQHWHLVEAVANALLEHKVLSGAQVRAVIDAANKSWSATHRVEN